MEAGTFSFQFWIHYEYKKNALNKKSSKTLSAILFEIKLWMSGDYEFGDYYEFNNATIMNSRIINSIIMNCGNPLY